MGLEILELERLRLRQLFQQKVLKHIEIAYLSGVNRNSL